MSKFLTSIKIADFLIKVIILFTTVVMLLELADKYNFTLFTSLALLFLFAITYKGIADFIRAGDKK